MRENTYLKTNKIVKRMRENIYLQTLKKDIKVLTKELKETQQVILKYIKFQKQKNEEFEKTFFLLLDGMRQNKETEEKNRQTMLNALFATITKQLEQKEKNALQ